MNAPVKAVTQAAFELIDKAQTHEPHVQVHALAATFILLVEAYQLDTQDVFTAVKNLMASTAAGHSDQYQALIAYVQHELKG